LEDEVNALAFSPDGKSLVAGSFNRAVPGALKGRGLRRWDVASGKELQTFDCSEDVFNVLFSPDGTQLATVGGRYPYRSRLWDVTTGKERPLPAGVGGRAVRAFSADGRLMVVAEAEVEPKCEVTLIEVASGQEVGRFAGHTSGSLCVGLSPDYRLLATGGGDATVLLWDLTGRQTPGVKPPPVDVEKCWADLASNDAGRAHAAVWGLATDPRKAVPFLRRTLRPAAALDQAGRGRLRRWVTELDSDVFATRQQAYSEIEKLGESAEPALREALKSGPNPEARRRIENLLEAFSGLTSSRLRTARAVMALERMATPDSRHLLEDIAKGAPESLASREAAAAVRRLDHPAPGTP
jgi:hypothetical protein